MRRLLSAVLLAVVLALGAATTARAQVPNSYSVWYCTEYFLWWENWNGNSGIYTTPIGQYPGWNSPPFSMECAYLYSCYYEPNGDGSYYFYCA